jgi:hypothetical protein
MYTASFAFFEAIWEAGISHCFVNLGSDHPSIIEAMVKGQREAKGKFPRIITCPNEVQFTPHNHLPPTSRHPIILSEDHMNANNSGRWSPCPWLMATPASPANPNA